MTQNSIMIAMSGGVDSAVSAYLASRDRTAAGVTMRLVSEGVGCAEATLEDVNGAAAVCQSLGLPHFVVDLGEDFRHRVVEPFVAAYEAGLTPNPCIFCNKAIKFGVLADFATAHGFERIATGHYARLERSNGRTLLRRAADASKDQTYMLWSLTQDVLSRAEFPLGDLSKAEARAIAAEQGFPMAARKDSQDICFIPDGDYAGFMEGYTGRTPEEGDFVDKNGVVLGRHKGIIHYTIGQRKGLGIALGEPAFVCDKDPVTRRVVLGKNEDLFTREVKLERVNLLSVESIDTPMAVTARIRSTHRGDAATVVMTGEDTATVTFDTLQRAICPGQSCVFYDGDTVVGGGIIRA